MQQNFFSGQGVGIEAVRIDQEGEGIFPLQGRIFPQGAAQVSGEKASDGNGRDGLGLWFGQVTLGSQTGQFFLHLTGRAGLVQPNGLHDRVQGRAPLGGGEAHALLGEGRTIEWLRFIRLLVPQEKHARLVRVLLGHLGGGDLGGGRRRNGVGVLPLQAGDDLLRG